MQGPRVLHFVLICMIVAGAASRATRAQVPTPAADPPAVPPPAAPVSSGPSPATPVAATAEVPGESAPAPHLQAARQAQPMRASAPVVSGAGGEIGTGATTSAGVAQVTAAQTGAASPTEPGVLNGATSAPAQEQIVAAPASKEATEAARDEIATGSHRELLKGELIYPGTRRLLSRFDHVGIGVGPEIIGNDYYATVDPGMAWYFDNGLSVSLHVPLRLTLLEGGQLAFAGLKVRRQDWNEISDYAQIIRFLTYGRKEANVYFSINTMRPATIGHGMLINRYSGDMDVDRSLTGVMLDAYNRYAGFELQANDITFQNRVMGGLVFVKPLSLLSASPYAEGVSLGVEAATDLRAPRCVLAEYSTTCVQGNGSTAVNSYTGASADNTYVRSDSTTGRFDVKQATVTAVGTSIEGKVYKDEHNTDVKLYGTWHRFTNAGGGDGFSGGAVARLNTGDKWISAFRLIGELRVLGDGFLPSYFDTLYEIQKYQYALRANSFQATPTKYQAVFGDPANGFARSHYGWRQGYNLEASWALFREKRSAKKIAFGVGISDSTGPDDTNFFIHLEIPMSWLQLFATYMGTNLTGPGDIFTARGWNYDKTVVLSGLRLEVLPFLYINASYERSFRTVASPGEEYHLGNNTAPGLHTLFENVQSVFLQVELGWELNND